MRQEDEEGIAQFDPYGQAGFGVGQVLGRDAAKRQQEILTGSSYSANMPPPGYRPGFDPEYLYFGDPRYADYAALLPGVYGDGYPLSVAILVARPMSGVDFHRHTARRRYGQETRSGISQGRRCDGAVDRRAWQATPDSRPRRGLMAQSILCQARRTGS